MRISMRRHARISMPSILRLSSPTARAVAMSSQANSSLPAAASCDPAHALTRGGAASCHRRRMTPIPLDNLCPIGGPHALVAHHVPERVVEKTNPERLANEPGVQMEDEEPAVLFAVSIQNVKTLLEHLAIAVNGHTPFPKGVNVVQFEHDRQGV